VIESFDIQKKPNQKLWRYCCHVMKYSQGLTSASVPDLERTKKLQNKWWIKKGGEGNTSQINKGKG